MGNVGQDSVESIYSFATYKPVPVIDIVSASKMSLGVVQDGFINLGWRGWEGNLPTPIINACPTANTDRKIIAYYNEAVITSTKRINPLTCYYHRDSRPDKINGIALTGVQVYMGNEIPELTESCVFTDFSGVLAYTHAQQNCMLHDYNIIDINYDFETASSFFTCLGTNLNQTRLFLGVYGSPNVTDLNQGTVYELLQ